jgi:hypothetical protein
MAMRKRADGIVPLCDLAAREKTSVSGVVEELLQEGVLVGAFYARRAAVRRRA